MGVELTISIITLIATAKKLLDFAKFVRAQDWNAAFTQLAAWGSGVLVLFLATQASITSHLVFANVTLGDYDFGSVVLGGMMIGSTASAYVDNLKARDQAQSAATPDLFSRT